MKNKKTKIILGLAILIGIIAIVGVGLSQYNKSHVNVKNTKADYILSPAKLISDYSSDEINADKNYVNKIIKIKGKISFVSTSNGKGTVTFNIPNSETGITCSFQSSESVKIGKLRTNHQVIIKGICAGMLLDIMMKECVIVE